MRRMTPRKYRLDLSEGRQRNVRAPAVVAVVVVFHAVAVGSAVLFMQGCGRTTGGASVEPPPAPIMPPSQAPSPARSSQTRPVFRPPVPVEPAPSVIDTSGAATYTVSKGDSLSKIAKRYGVSANDLARINNISDPNKIRAGQKLMLPPGATAGAGTSAPAPAPRHAAAPAAPTLSGSSYVVQSGDSLSKIAKLHGVSWHKLAEANGISDPNRIKVGQKLTIPRGAASAGSAHTSTATPPPAAAPAPATPESYTATPPDDTEVPADEKPLDYTVLTGDTLEDIAKLFIVSKEDIMELNNLTSEEIQPGMKLLIPPPEL